MSEPTSEPELGAFDLDLSAEVETEVKTLIIKLRGGYLRVPRDMGKWTLETVNLMTEGKGRDALIEFAQTPADKAALKSVTFDQLNRIMDHVAKVTGITPGE